MDKDNYAYRVRYHFLFRLLRGNPSIENNLISTKYVIYTAGGSAAR